MVTVIKSMSREEMGYAHSTHRDIKNSYKIWLQDPHFGVVLLLVL
jgi:hypothetical protein